MNKKTSQIVIALLVAFLPLIAAQAVPLSTNAAWTWVKGSNIVYQSGTYGTQGVTDPANMPGARRDAVSWKDTNSAPWIFGGLGMDAFASSGYLNDLWKFDPATTNWTWMKGSNFVSQYGIYGTWQVADPANTPGARAGAASLTDNSGALWLFGGYGCAAAGGVGELNDLWKFDPATTNWTWMKGATWTNQNGTYGWQGEASPVNTPGARFGAAYCMDNTGVLWIFGGWGYDAFGVLGYLNDLWKFDPVTTNWTWMKGNNIVNQYGTYGTPGVADPANTPGAREMTSLWVDNSGGALWLFGGYGYAAAGGMGYLNDLWKFDPVTTNWTWMKGTNIIDQNGTYGLQGVADPVNTPGASSGVASWADYLGALWLFGGYGYAAGGMGDLNDLWKFDPVTTNWTWMKGSTTTNQSGTYGSRGEASPINTPGARAGAVSWVDNSGALWLFGGNGYDASGTSGYLSDLWKFDAFAGGIVLDTHALAFSATFLGANPVAQTIGMTNVGGKGIAYTNVITYGAGASGWLTVLPAAGAVAPNGATVLTNLVNIAGLGAGTYYATNQVTANDATNSPQTVVVTLTVNNPTVISSGVCADYDGDGLADPAVYDESTGTWRVKLSGANYYQIVTTLGGLGGPGLASVSADYDGDGKADPAVYQESNGEWTILRSSLNYATWIFPQTLGGPGYSGMPGDYDGDYKADPGVYQRALGDWKVLLSSANYYLVEALGLLGGTGFLPVAADYDGDRKADPAVYGESNGVWTIMLSSANYFSIVLAQTLGGSGYIPVPADYDGDGLADPAVRSESSNDWIVMLSTAGYTPVHVTLSFE